MNNVNSPHSVMLARYVTLQNAATGPTGPSENSLLPPAAGLQLRIVAGQQLIVIWAVKREGKKHRLAVPICETSI